MDASSDVCFTSSSVEGSEAVLLLSDDEDGSEGVAATIFLRKLMKPSEYSVSTRQTEMTKASIIVFFF